MENPTPPRATPIILGFAQDDEGHWFVALSCGHTQHLRHLPPWQSRTWVLDPLMRAEKIGQSFACGWCARDADNDNLAPRNVAPR